MCLLIELYHYGIQGFNMEIIYIWLKENYLYYNKNNIRYIRMLAKQI
ncbi:hypothetical protein BACPEC_02821 [[Bacteroides] pectinophilus ATCC 43243]|uniref:Uncharacterized protein n=1 Tax=[Bacteroides] pectinophilus ATCC 43243 TaxID=483218 RepID=B7AVS1_9FIRM|nr:hypothetical protein BACPEC_02821 [[Bacteroides] pectinophilus ATCC 43243]